MRYDDSSYTRATISSYIFGFTGQGILATRSLSGIALYRFYENWSTETYTKGPSEEGIEGNTYYPAIGGCPWGVEDYR